MKGIIFSPTCVIKTSTLRLQSSWTRYSTGNYLLSLEIHKEVTNSKKKDSQVVGRERENNHLFSSHKVGAFELLQKFTMSQKTRSFLFPEESKSRGARKSVEKFALVVPNLFQQHWMNCKLCHISQWGKLWNFRTF